MSEMFIAMHQECTFHSLTLKNVGGGSVVQFDLAIIIVVLMKGLSNSLNLQI